MILKCAAKKFACAAHAAKNEGQAHMKQPSNGILKNIMVY